MTIEATETKLSVADVPEDELWDISEFKDYRIKLINNAGQDEIIDLQEWKSKKSNEITLSSNR